MFSRFDTILSSMMRSATIGDSTPIIIKKITRNLDVLSKNGKRHWIQRWKYFSNQVFPSQPFSKNFNLLRSVQSMHFGPSIYFVIFFLKKRSITQTLPRLVSSIIHTLLCNQLDNSSSPLLFPHVSSIIPLISWILTLERRLYQFSRFFTRRVDVFDFKCV